MLSVGIHFLEDGEVDFIVGSPPVDELLLLKSYFEVGLRLLLHPLLRHIVCHLHLSPNQLCINTVRLIMSLVILDHMKGLGILTTDVLYIYNVKRSRIPHEWYLFPQLAMSGFIIGAPSTNKDLDKGIFAVFKNWKFWAY